MVVGVHQDLDILEVVLEDMEDPVDMEDLVEEMQEMTEVAGEKDMETVTVEIATVDVADGSRCKT